MYIYIMLAESAQQATNKMAILTNLSCTSQETHFTWFFFLREK